MLISNYQIRDELGEILKQTRIESGYSREQVSERVGISLRYLIAIENENKKPSYEVLFQLIRELNVKTDTIFFPESKSINTKLEKLIRLIYQCDERDLTVVTATVNALLNEKQQ